MSGKNEHGNCNGESAIFSTVFAGAPEPVQPDLPECYSPIDPAHFDKIEKRNNHGVPTEPYGILGGGII